MNRVVRSTNVRGFDRQTRHLYVPHESAIPELEDGTPVGSVYEVWANQRKDNGSLPTTDNLPDEFCMTRKTLDLSKTRLQTGGHLSEPVYARLPGAGNSAMRP